MAGRFETVLRLAALGIVAALVAACAPVEGPRLGSGPPVLAPSTLKTLSKPDPVTSVVTFSLDPITNAPGEMIYAFEDSLKSLAPTRQLKIIDGTDSQPDYRLKAFLSAVGDYSNAQVMYVVDVFNSAGARVHRVSGQITASGSQNDPWSTATGGAVINDAAQEVIDDLGNWVHT